jgi:hypothetical protein
MESYGFLEITFNIKCLQVTTSTYKWVVMVNIKYDHLWII